MKKIKSQALFVCLSLNMDGWTFPDAAVNKHTLSSWWCFVLVLRVLEALRSTWLGVLTAIPQMNTGGWRG